MNRDDSHSAIGRSCNEDYESDIDHALRYTRRFFTLIGIWPRIASNPTFIGRFVSRLMLPISLSFMLMDVVLLMLHLILEETSGYELILMMGPLSFDLTCLLKHVSLLLHSRFIKICMEHMETDWRRIDNDNDRGIMMRNLKVGHDVTIMCFVCMYSGGVFYHGILPLCTRESNDELNGTDGRRSFAGAGLFLDTTAGYNYEIIFCGLCISSFIRYTVVASACNLAAILVTHACGQIELITFRLKNLLKTDDREAIGKDLVANRIATIIRYHVRVLKFASQIDQILREICLLEVVSSTVIICLVEYCCVTEWNNSDSIAMTTYVLLLVSVSFNVYIYCYVGELLKKQFHQVRIAAYNFEWYELPGKTGLAIVMIITVANYPPSLTAGRMIELSIHTFGTIIRTSLGYLNMLREMTK